MPERGAVILYGNDQGANNVLKLVQEAAQAEGLNTLRIPGLNAQIPEELKVRASRASAVVLGVSGLRVSGKMPEAEFASDLLLRNPNLAGKIVFIEDFPTSTGIQYPPLRKIGSAAHLCTILPSLPDAPERRVYRKVHTVGYPDHWLPAIENIGVGIRARESGVVRKRRRGSAESCLVGPDEVVVYVSGFVGFRPKYLRQILDIKEVLGRPVVAHYRAHPSEQNIPKLKRLIEERDALLEGQWEIANEEIAMAGRDSDPRLTGVSDIVVAHPGHTANFYAGSLQIRMVCVMEFVSRENLKSSSYHYPSTGLRTHLVQRVSDIRGAMEALLTDGSPEQLELAEKQRLNTIPFDPQNPPSYGRNVLGVVRVLIV